MDPAAATHWRGGYATEIQIKAQQASLTHRGQWKARNMINTLNRVDDRAALRDT
jgi:hypothetical protein